MEVIPGPTPNVIDTIMWISDALFSEQQRFCRGLLLSPFAHTEITLVWLNLQMICIVNTENCKTFAT